MTNTTTTTISRPADGEYGSFYAGYVARVPDGDVFALWRNQPATLKALLGSFSAEQAEFRYAPEAWSIKQVIGHIIETERVFAYRALRISRNDTTPLPGFDQDSFIANWDYSTRTLESLLEEFELIRRANVLAFEGISDEISRRTGTASNYPITVRALLYIMAGHVEYHIQDLHKDYFPKMGK
jgi:hypothetical protein